MSAAGWIALLIFFGTLVTAISAGVDFNTDVWTDNGVVAKVSVTYTGSINGWVAQIVVNTTAHGVVTINKAQLDSWSEPTGTNTILSAKVGEIIGITYHRLWPCYDIAPRPQQ